MDVNSISMKRNKPNFPPNYLFLSDSNHLHQPNFFPNPTFSSTSSLNLNFTPIHHCWSSKPQIYIQLRTIILSAILASEKSHHRLVADRPGVTYHYQRKKEKKIKHAGQGRNPSWNETFKFQVNSQGSNIQHKLTLRVMDHDTFSRDDFIGEATINVTDLIAIGMEKGSIEQHPTKYSVVLPDRSYCGEIRVGINFKAKMQEEEEQELGGWKHSFHA